MTTNNLKATLVATFAQYSLMRRALAFAEVGSTAPRTVSEYSGLGKRVSAVTARYNGDDAQQSTMMVNLEELKTLRRALRKLAEREGGCEMITFAEAMLDAHITDLNAARVRANPSTIKSVGLLVIAE